MKQITKNKKILYLLGLILIVVSIVIIANLRVKGGASFDCSTSWRIQHNNPGFTARLNVFLHVQKNGSGLFDVTGKVDLPDGVYEVARTYYFTYTQQGDSVYHLTDLTTSSRRSETVNNDLMNNLFFSTTQPEGRYMRMTKMENSYVIDNLYSPVFICLMN